MRSKLKCFTDKSKQLSYLKIPLNSVAENNTVAELIRMASTKQKRLRKKCMKLSHDPKI